MNTTSARTRTAVSVAAATALLAGIVAANYVTARYGFVPVGFGLTTTAGTFLAGAFLALRDLLHDNAGRGWVLAVIALGAAVSLAIAPPTLAVASAVAFLLAELADLAVYTPLRRRSNLGDRRWTAAVVASNAVGALVDTLVFLAIAFGTVHGTGGQLVGKAWMTLAYLASGYLLAQTIRHRHTGAVA